MVRAREALISGNVPTIDPNYRTVMLGEGTSFLAVRWVRQATWRKLATTDLLCSDTRRPRSSGQTIPGLCCIRGFATNVSRTSLSRKKKSDKNSCLPRRLSEKTLTLTVDSADYSLVLPYQALASLYAHVGNFRSALDSLKSAREVESIGPESEHLDVEIRSMEQFLQGQQSAN
jgi:hypothetical protein